MPTCARSTRPRPIEDIVPEFFSTMRLPEQGARAPEPGEAIALQYGGYLRLGAEVSAGYQLAGTKSVAIGQLALSEKYDLSIVGKIGLSAGVAGRFSILVTAGDLPGWCRVQVRRHRAKDFKIAADVNVAFKNELDLPANANEFLGAALGVNAKNFLNVFAKARRAVGLRGVQEGDRRPGEEVRRSGHRQGLRRAQLAGRVQEVPGRSSTRS